MKLEKLFMDNLECSSFNFQSLAPHVIADILYKKGREK